jgi:tetrahydromethanopterin S-methyltransferase subunit H
MTYGVNGLGSQDGILDAALEVARNACTDLDQVLTDVQSDGKINSDQGLSVAGKYGYSTGSGEINISTASGAMVVDDLMQKISTKVQSAAQMLSAANNINKTASRLLSQG